jgi:hypothetical protein
MTSALGVTASWRRGVAILVALGVIAFDVAACGSPPVPSLRPSVPVSSPSIESVPPSPSQAAATPSPTPAVGSWRPVLDPALVSTPVVAGDYTTAAVIKDVALYRGRIVAVGSDPLGGAVWSSADGISWRREAQDPDLDDIALRSVVAGRGGLVAIGDGAPDGARLFHSQDGVAWRPVQARAIASRQSSATAIDTMTYGRAGFVATGRLNQGDCSDSCVPTPTIVWTSRDGIGWGRSAVIPPPNKTGPVISVNALVPAGRGYLAFGSAVWRSRNGRSWTLVDRLPRSKRLDRVFRVRGTYVAIHGGDHGSAILRSSDGFAWRTMEVPHGSRATIQAIAPTRPGLLAVGFRVGSGTPNEDGETSPVEEPVIWTSSNGRSWTDAMVGSPSGVGRLEAATVAGDRPLALGTRAADPSTSGDAAVWSTWPIPNAPVPASPTPGLTTAGSWESLPQFTLPAAPAGVVWGRSLSLVVSGAEIPIVYELGSDTEGGDITGIAWWVPSTGAIRPGPTVAGIHEGAVVAHLHDQLIVLGGGNTFGSARADLFDLAMKRWRHVRLSYGLSSVAGALISGNRILAVTDEGYNLIDGLTFKSLNEGITPFAYGATHVFPLADRHALIVTTKRAWVFDPMDRTWRPGPAAPRVGGLGPGAVLADGRVVLFRTQSGSPSRTWLDVIAADGSTWRELEAPPLTGTPIAVLTQPDGSLLVVSGTETCDEEENCYPDAELIATRAIGVVPP